MKCPNCNSQVSKPNVFSYKYSYPHSSNNETTVVLKTCPKCNWILSEVKLFDVGEKICQKKQ